MRHFFSYGPVDCEEHFCVPRKELIDQCTLQLVGNVNKGGHYFTIWAPRQTGKTWIMRQVKDEIQNRYKDQFVIGAMSMQGVIADDDHPDNILPWVPNLIRDTFRIKVDAPESWQDWINLFHIDAGLFNKPVILFIDEFDSLPPKMIDRLVTLFRDMYLKRDAYLLHGLALIGVRAVLGVESERGSPFNVQRSLHIPNFTEEEVSDLFRQYREESGQEVESGVVRRVHEATRGQPGLVCWFGELLAEKYNPGKDQIIDSKAWRLVYNKALNKEWNNTLLNLTKKAKGKYVNHILNLFSKSDIEFSLRVEWCNYLYLNGIIESEGFTDRKGAETELCRFSSPFVQECLYNALAEEYIGERTPIPALDFLDTLEGVFEEKGLNLKALLRRYQDYLARLKEKGLNPWKGQPRRDDLNYREAVGHFHLYAWLQMAIGDECIISPEFPTGNGKVDIHLRYDGIEEIIEVKSFTKARDVKKFIKQAAGYAASLRKEKVAIALFVPSQDEKILDQFVMEEMIEGVTVWVVPIGWVT